MIIKLDNYGNYRMIVVLHVSVVYMMFIYCKTGTVLTALV